MIRAIFLALALMLPTTWTIANAADPAPAAEGEKAAGEEKKAKKSTKKAKKAEGAAEGEKPAAEKAK